MRYSIIGFFCAVFVFAGCQSTAPSNDSTAMQDNAAPTTDQAVAAAPSHTAVLTVYGMACPQCANNVDVQLMAVPGVESVTIDMGSGRVLAQLTPEGYPTRDQLAEAIGKTGFTLVGIEMPE